MFGRKNIQQLKQDAQKVILSESEQKKVRESLASYMEMHPVRKNDAVRQRGQNHGSWFLFLTRHPMMAAIALILTLVCGGTAYAAEGSLPGDTLYPVKVSVNENVRTALALSTEDKADWEARLTERRLEEAAKLAARGELKGDIEARLAQSFEDQAEKVKTRIARLEAEGETDAAATLSSRLETNLQVHEQILANLALRLDARADQDVSTTSTPEQPFLQKVRLRAKDAMKERTEFDEHVSTTLRAEVKTAAENRVREADNKIQEVRRFLSERAEKLGAEATVKAGAKLDEAVKVQDEAQTALKEEHYGEAFALAGKAARMAQEAKLLINVKVDFNVDLDIKKLLDESRDEFRQMRETFEDEREEKKVEIKNEIRKRVELRVEDRKGREEEREGTEIEKESETEVETEVRGLVR